MYLEGSILFINCNVTETSISSWLKMCSDQSSDFKNQTSRLSYFSLSSRKKKIPKCWLLLFIIRIYHLVPNISIFWEYKRFSDDVISANVFFRSKILKLPYPTGSFSKSLKIITQKLIFTMILKKVTVKTYLFWLTLSLQLSSKLR